MKKLEDAVEVITRGFTGVSGEIFYGISYPSIETHYETSEKCYKNHKACT